MACLSPVTLAHPTRRALAKAYYEGRIESVERLEELLSKFPEHIIVPCGKCAGCLDTKRDEWIFRIHRELKAHPHAYFITLTYDNDNLPHNDKGIAVIDRHHVSLFIRYVRRKIACRYFFISEYGPRTSRPHYHGILFFDYPFKPSDVQTLCELCWSRGFVKVGEVNQNRIRYVASYCVKPLQNVPEGATKNFTHVSQKPFLGYSDNDFTPANYDRIVSSVEFKGVLPDAYDPVTKRACRYPRVIREKLLSDEFKELVRFNTEQLIKDSRKRFEATRSTVIDAHNIAREHIKMTKILHNKKSRKI